MVNVILFIIPQHRRKSKKKAYIYKWLLSGRVIIGCILATNSPVPISVLKLSEMVKPIGRRMILFYSELIFPNS